MLATETQAPIAPAPEEIAAGEPSNLSPSDVNSDRVSNRRKEWPEPLIKVVQDLTELQQKYAKSDTQFARDHLSKAPNQWCKIRNLNYPVKDLAKLQHELERDLRRAVEASAVVRKVTGTGPFFQFAHVQAIFHAVTECASKTNENRLIPIVAETGGGKSTVIRHLYSDHGAVVVEAKESWRGSYLAAARDLCHGLGMTGRIYSATEAETVLLERLQKRKTIIAIDECNYFGSRTINLIKLILNKSDTVVVFACLPAFYTHIQRFWDEWVQLKRRIHCVFRLDRVTPDDVRQFLAAAHVDIKGAPAAIAKAANSFGLYDMVNRVVTKLAELPEPSFEDVEKSLALVRQELGE